MINACKALEQCLAKSYTFDKQQLLPLTEPRKDSLPELVQIISHECDAQKYAIDFLGSESAVGEIAGLYQKRLLLKTSCIAQPSVICGYPLRFKNCLDPHPHRAGGPRGQCYRTLLVTVSWVNCFLFLFLFLLTLHHGFGLLNCWHAFVSLATQKLSSLPPSLPGTTVVECRTAALIEGVGKGRGACSITTAYQSPKALLPSELLPGTLLSGGSVSSHVAWSWFLSAVHSFPLCWASLQKGSEMSFWVRCTFLKSI